MFLEIELHFFGVFFHNLQNLSLEVGLAIIVSKDEYRSLEYGSVRFNAHLYSLCCDLNSQSSLAKSHILLDREYPRTSGPQ
jgi:hypothetical protein